MDVLSKYIDAIIGGLIGTLVGTLCVHQLTLWREKRKEFNEIAQPIRELLIGERNARSLNSRGLGELKAEQLEYFIPWWKKRDFRGALAAYRRSKQNTTRNVMGEVLYTDFNETIRYIDKLLKYTKRR